MHQQTTGSRIYVAAYLGLVVSIVAAFVTALLVSRDLGLSQSEPSSRMRYHAIPVAISQIYHGRAHDYTAYWSIAMRFHNDHPLEPAIRDAISAQISAGDRTYYWTADDRGLSDFVNVGFRLFGPTMSALFYFWFLLLGLSIATAVIRFRRDATALALIACAVIGIGATLPALTRAAAESFAEASIHLAESRMFDILGIIAIIHLILTMFRPGTAPLWLDIGTIIVQAALIAALVHARASVSWLFIAIISIGLVLAFLRWKGPRPVRQTWSIVVVLCIVITTWTSVHAYQRVMFNKAYWGEIGPRTFWHNVLMGLGVNPTFAHRLNMPQIEDRLAVEAVLNDMRIRNDPRLTEQWETHTILNSLGSVNTFDWPTYEHVARDLVIRTLLSDPWQALRLAAWDKPKNILTTLSCQFFTIIRICDPRRFKSVAFLDRSRMRPFPWIWFGVLPLVAICLLLAQRGKAEIAQAKEASGGIVALLLFTALFGLLPSILIYTGVTQLGGTVVLLYTAFCFSIVLAAARIQGIWSWVAARALRNSISA